MPVDEYSPLLPKNETGSALGDLWLLSRFKQQPKEGDVEALENTQVLAPNQYRSLTWYHFKISLRLAALCFPSFIGLLWQAHKLALVLTVVCSILSGIIPTITSYTSAKLLDEVQYSLQFGQVRLDMIEIYAALTVGLSIFRLFFNYITQYSRTSLRREIDFIAGSLLQRNTLRMDIQGMLDPYRRDVLEAAEIFAGKKNSINRRGEYSYDANASSLFFNATSTITALASLISSVLLLLSTLAKSRGDSRLLRIQLAMIFVALLPSLIGLLSTLQTHHSRQRWNPFLWRRRYQLESLSKLEHRKELIIGNLQDWVLEKWRQTEKAIRDERGLMNNWNWLKQISNVCGAVCVDTSFKILLAMRLFPQAITLGSASLLQSVARQLISSLDDLYTVAEGLYQTIFFLAAFTEASNIQPVVQPQFEESDKVGRQPVIFKPMQGPDGATGVKIEARNLSFKYPSAKKYALSNISFTVMPGETLAIVGFNGSGKTTLLQILMRLLEYEGHLYINDVEAKMYEPASLHLALAACFQDHSRFPLTLRENIIASDLTKANDQAAIDRALRDSGVADFLDDLPAGLETRLSLSPEAPRSNSKKTKQEEEANETSLSGGQWQKVSLARAFLKVPSSSLVVLDEPSSALDARAEHELFERIAKLSQDDEGRRIRTNIFVTHRFNTVRRADRIAVFEKGQIVEYGTHEELMKLEKGVYNEFYTLQAQSFAD